MGSESAFFFLNWLYHRITNYFLECIWVPSAALNDLVNFINKSSSVEDFKRRSFMNGLRDSTDQEGRIEKSWSNRSPASDAISWGRNGNILNTVSMLSSFISTSSSSSSEDTTKWSHLEYFSDRESLILLISSLCEIFFCVDSVNLETAHTISRHTIFGPITEKKIPFLSISLKKNVSLWKKKEHQDAKHAHNRLSSDNVVDVSRGRPTTSSDTCKKT